MKWQLNNIKFPIYNLGPGKRIGIWVQGCSLACTGCINKTLWSEKGGDSLDVLEVYNNMALMADDFDGITISGGEPFEQYEQLIAFLHLIKLKTRLHIYCFTGYDLSELEELYPDQLYMKYIDQIMTGRFEQDKWSEDNLRGSSNQKLYNFQNGRAELLLNPDTSNNWSIFIGDDQQIHMSAIPKNNELKQIEADLKQHNINKKFI